MGRKISKTEMAEYCDKEHAMIFYWKVDHPEGCPLCRAFEELEDADRFIFGAKSGKIRTARRKLYGA